MVKRDVRTRKTKIGYKDWWDEERIARRRRLYIECTEDGRMEKLGRRNI